MRAEKAVFLSGHVWVLYDDCTKAFTVDCEYKPLCRQNWCSDIASERPVAPKCTVPHEEGIL